MFGKTQDDEVSEIVIQIMKQVNEQLYKLGSIIKAKKCVTVP
jgi:hypothetical protein